MFPPTLLDTESVDEVMATKGEETIANDLWNDLRPLLLAGENRMQAARVVIDTFVQHGIEYQDSPLLVADYTGELPDDTSHILEMCQYETCRQPATWRGFLECEGVIPVCSQCVVEVDDPVLL